MNYECTEWACHIKARNIELKPDSFKELKILKKVC